MRWELNFRKSFTTILYSIVVIIAFLFSSTSFVDAKILINEFSSGTSSDWVELYNSGEEEVDLSIFILRDENASNSKSLTGTLLPNELVSFTYSNYLNNNQDTVFLYKLVDTNEELEDSIPYGEEGQVCAPSKNGSIGRYPSDGNSTYDRFVQHTRDASNIGATLDSCPTPTPEPSDTPTPTTKPTSTPKPTATTKPTNTPSPIPTSKPVATKKPTTVLGEDEEDEDSGEIILGLRDQMESEEEADNQEENDKEEKKKFPIAAVVLITGGLGFIGAAAYPLLKDKIKVYNFLDAFKRRKDIS